MKQRISFWALVGLLVAGCWFLYGIIAMPLTDQNVNWTLAAITAPASLIGRTMPLKYYWFILLNGAIYALVGLMAELMRPALIGVLKLTRGHSLA
jgi:hypothetical protein